jgi:hypothetical protein
LWPQTLGLAWFVRERQLELAGPVGVSERVDADDPALRERELEHDL